MRFANVMNNPSIIKIFYSDESNITYIKRKHQKIKATATNRVLRSELMIKIPLLKVHTLLLLVLAVSILSSPLNKFYGNAINIRSIYQNQKN